MARGDKENRVIDSRLITEVQTDPLARGYAAMSAEQIRASLYDTAGDVVGERKFPVTFALRGAKR